MINDRRLSGNSKSPDQEPRSSLVGARVRRLRQAYGMSQRKLAGMAGVTNGAISMIEQDRVSPSVASLKKIVEVFGLSLVEFFSDDFAVQPQIFCRADQMTRLVDGPVTLRQIGGISNHRKMQVLHETYTAGGDTGPVMLAHEGEEAGVVVRGQIEITVGNQTEILGPGDGYYFDSRQPHRFRNPGPVECEIVSSCTPPSF